MDSLKIGVAGAAGPIIIVYCFIRLIEIGAY